MADDDYTRRCGARRLPDYTDQLQTGVERARNKANVNKRIIELGEELADAQHDIGELQGRQTIAGSMQGNRVKKDVTIGTNAESVVIL